MILKDPIYIDEKLTGLYFLESTVDTIPDAVSGNIQFGVGIHPLSDVLSSQFKEGARAYYRKLDCTRSLEFCDRLKQAYEKVKTVPYNFNPIDWLFADLAVGESIKEYEAEYHLRPADLQSTKALWCSALVGYMYSHLGLLPRDTPWNILSPADFSSESNIITLVDCQLDKEVKLTSPL